VGEGEYEYFGFPAATGVLGLPRGGTSSRGKVKAATVLPNNLSVWREWEERTVTVLPSPSREGSSSSSKPPEGSAASHSPKLSSTETKQTPETRKEEARRGFLFNTFDFGNLHL